VLLFVEDEDWAELLEVLEELLEVAEEFWLEDRVLEEEPEPEEEEEETAF
jgi:hypothetical protein